MSHEPAASRVPAVSRWGHLRRCCSIAFLVLAVSALTAVALEVTTARALSWGMRAQLARVGVATLTLETLLLSTLVVGIFALTGRLRRAIPLAAMLAVLLVAVNFLKATFRSEPLYPSDFAYATDAGLLTSSVGIKPVLIATGAVVGVGLVTWLAILGLGRLLRVPPALGRRGPRWLLWARGVTVLAAAGLATAAFWFNTEGNPVRTAFERAGASWVAWSQNENYRLNGFLGGFLYNMPSPPMAEPEGYSQAAIQDVVDRYTARAQEINEDRDATALDDMNVVVILGESFFDPTRLEGLELTENPLTFTQSLMEESRSGTLRSVAMGGGTANVECEVLTGMSAGTLSQSQPPYQGVVSQSSSFPSVLARVTDTHETVGIHPFVADFYRRGDAWRALGFEESYFADAMTHTWKVASESGYIADGAAYEELLDVLTTSDEPVFGQVVTMQNHAGYAGLYPDPIQVEAPASATESWGLSDYLRGLSHADAALDDLLTSLEALDEPTVVLFYGDHTPPGVIPADVWDAQDSDTIRYETPWFVWSTEGVASEQMAGLEKPTFLWNQVLSVAGAAVTPWDALLLDLEADYQREQGGAEASADLQRDYLLAQYDMAVGAGYGTEAFLSVPEEP